jgi:hypothetical protein
VTEPYESHFDCKLRALEDRHVDDLAHQSNRCQGLPGARGAEACNVNLAPRLQNESEPDVVDGRMRFVPFVGSIIAAFFPIALAAAVDPAWSMVLATAARLSLPSRSPDTSSSPCCMASARDYHRWRS